jgi:predicted esterase
MLGTDLETKKRTPVFLYHGKDDELIPSSFAGRTYKALNRMGLDHIHL